MNGDEDRAPRKKIYKTREIKIWNAVAFSAQHKL
jgi:hypothetical protein